jgi:lipopolysaccharide export system permease protein
MSFLVPTLIARYLARNVGAAVLFVLSAFLALFAFFDFINELDDIGRGTYGLGAAAAYVVLTLPSRAYEILPIAALIGTVYALAQLAANSEFTAMRVAGLGRARAIAHLALVGIGIALATALVGEALAPPAERLAQQIRLTSLGSAIGGQLRSGLWVRDSARSAEGDLERIRFVNIGELLPDATMKRVRVFEFDRNMILTETMEAASARFELPASWRLSQVDLRRFRIDAGEAGAQRVTVQEERQAERLWSSEITPALLSVLMVSPDRMSALSLFSYIRHLQENRQATERYQIAFWKKVTYPLAVVVMMAVALPFAYMQTRSGGIGYKVFGGIMLGVGFHFTNSLFSHLGMINTWPPLLAVSVPSLMALALALALLVWVDRSH